MNPLVNKEALFSPEFDPGLNAQPTLWPQYTGLSTGGGLSRFESLWPECNKLAGLCSCMFLELLCLPMERKKREWATCSLCLHARPILLGCFIFRVALVDPQEHVSRKISIECMRTSWRNADGNMWSPEEIHTKNSSDGSEYTAPTEQAFFPLFSS